VEQYYKHFTFLLKNKLLKKMWYKNVVQKHVILKYLSLRDELGYYIINKIITVYAQKKIM